MTKIHKHSACVAHHLSTRTRLKVPKNLRSAHNMNTLETSLKKISHVKNLAINPKSGSITIEHDEHPDIFGLISDTLKNSSGELFEALIEGESLEVVGASMLGNMIYENFAKLDKYISEATNNNIDLKLLLPIGFLTAGLYKASKTSAWTNQIPTFVLFYYAYDSFLKFHNKNTMKKMTSNGHNRISSLKA